MLRQICVSRNCVFVTFWSYMFSQRLNVTIYFKGKLNRSTWWVLFLKIYLWWNVFETCSVSWEKFLLHHEALWYIKVKIVWAKYNTYFGFKTKIYCLIWFGQEFSSFLSASSFERTLLPLSYICRGATIVCTGIWNLLVLFSIFWSPH